MSLTPSHRDLERLTAQRDVPEGFSLAAIRARNGATNTPTPRLITPKRRQQPVRRKFTGRILQPADPIRTARSTERYRELRRIFTPEQATALVLAGYVTRPGRFQRTSATGVNANSLHLPAKDDQDPDPTGRVVPAPVALPDQGSLDHTAAGIAAITGVVLLAVTVLWPRSHTHTIMRVPSACQVAASRAASDLSWLRKQSTDALTGHRNRALFDGAHVTAVGSTPGLGTCR